MAKAVHDEPALDQEADVADKMAEAGGAVLAQVDEEDDMTNVVAEQGSVNVKVPGSDGGGDAEVPEGADTAQVDNGGAARVTVEEGGGAVPIPVDDTRGADHVRVPIAAGGGDGPVHTDGGGVKAKTADGGDHVRVQVTIDDGGGAASVEAEEGSDVAYDVVDTGDFYVHTHIDEGGGAVQVTERRALTKNDGGGGVHNCVFDEHDHVDDEAEFTKEIGTAACSRTMEEILMTKQDWFVHATADKEFAVAKYVIAGGEGAVNAPIEKEVDLTKVVEDQGDFHVPAHIDEGRGAVEIHEAEDMAMGDEVDNDVHTPVDDGGGTVHVKTPVVGGRRCHPGY
jgi:hypothetical protein